MEGSPGRKTRASTTIERAMPSMSSAMSLVQPLKQRSPSLRSTGMRANGEDRPQQLQQLALGGAGTWLGTGICDLRATVQAQQQQMDSLVDKVAVLLSSMHSEVLQDLRSFAQSPGFEAQVQEMRRLGEALDSRLAELRQAEKQELQGSAELRRLEERVAGLDLRLSRDVEKLQEMVSESMMSVHDRFTSELEAVVSELKKLDARLGSAESEVGLALTEEDVDAACRQAVQQMADALRMEFQQYVAPLAEQSSKRVGQLEDHLQREHGDLLLALQQAAGANAASAGEAERAARRGREELRQQGEELTALARQISELRMQQARLEESKAEKASVAASREEDATLARNLEGLRSLEATVRGLQASVRSLEERPLPSPPPALPPALPPPKAENFEQRLANALAPVWERLEGWEQRLQDLEAARPGASAAAVSRSNEEVLQALELKLERATGDLQRQLEAQIARLEPREVASAVQGPHLERQVEVRLQESAQSAQRLANELRQEWDAKASSFQRTGEDLRRELELKIEKKHSMGELAMEEMKHKVDNLSLQQQSATQRLGEELRQLKAEVEIRMVKGQGATQRMMSEMRKDVEVAVAENYGASSELLQQERLQLIHDFREELERRLQKSAAAVPPPPPPKEASEIREVQQQLESVRLLAEGARSAAAKVPDVKQVAQEVARHAAAALEEDFSERLGRCENAAASCEQLTQELEKRLREVSSELKAHQQLVTAVTAMAPTFAAEDTAAAAANAAFAAASEVLSARNSPARSRSSPNRSQHKELFRRSEESHESRVSPIEELTAEESDTESRISMLMQRVDLQASALETLRQKNDQLSHQVDRYNLQQKVSRSLAGLEE
ncbi:unnamed protein product [Effrenium voratum]|uniref:Uncharacterized protein n=1 Tax=Effrenium voratum TaxID=2562239 RepID=A0AA36J056_9DINO|nr:unnamed protein product [Effrenium voratum]